MQDPERLHDWRIQTQSKWQTYLRRAWSSPMGPAILALLLKFLSFCLQQGLGLVFRTRPQVPSFAINTLSQEGTVAILLQEVRSCRY